MLKEIIIKTTRYCNVGCKHCYLTAKQRNNKISLTSDGFDLILNKLNKYYNFFFSNKNNIGNNKINIIFHGGEPLLIEYELLNYFFKKTAQTNFYKSVLQTSLFPLFDKNYEERKKYYKLFKKHNVVISTSYDFFGIRTYKGNEELYEKKLLEIVKELNDYEIEVHLLFGINKKIQDKEEFVFNWLLKNKNFFKKISYEPFIFYKSKPSIDFITNKEISEILIKFYELSNKYNIKFISNLIDIENNLKSFKNLPNQFYASCQSDLLVISPEGNVTNCSTKLDYESFGNIYKQELEEILKNKTRIEWILLQNKHLKICKICEFKNICNGGCPVRKYNFIHNQQEKYQNIENCPGFYPLLKYIHDNIQGINNV